MTPREAVNQALRRGSIEAVSDEGQVTLRLPNGKREIVLVPLEHVARLKAATEEQV